MVELPNIEPQIENETEISQGQLTQAAEQNSPSEEGKEPKSWKEVTSRVASVQPKVRWQSAKM